MLPKVGDLIGGKYRIVRLIGEGGMGAVYEARHEVLGASVALKFLQPALAKSPELIARFMQEARVAATVQSPHVARVTDVERVPNGSAYLVMELLSGASLQNRLDAGAPLPRDEAIDIGLQILLGLETAHARGVVHRDLKPDNVFIVQTPGGGLVKLLDFGIAKLREVAGQDEFLTRPGEVMGTPEYMAPEQAVAADRVDVRADVFSVGVILYEMLCGVRPVAGAQISEILEKIITGQSVPLAHRDPSLPPELCALIDRAVAADPDARPSSAKEFRLALARFAGMLSHAGQMAAVEDPGVTLGPRAFSMLPATSRGVPSTVPPVEAGPPASVMATEIRYDRPSIAERPSRTLRMRRSPRWAFFIGFGVLLVSGGVGVALYARENPYFLSHVLRVKAPPPLPSASIHASPELPPLVYDDKAGSTSQPQAKTDSPSAPRAPATQNTGRAPSAPSVGVPVPFPTFSLPSAFPPIPSGIPTALPEIPGLPPFYKPGAPATPLDPSKGAAPEGQGAAPGG